MTPTRPVTLAEVQPDPSRPVTIADCAAYARPKCRACRGTGKIRTFSRVVRGKLDKRERLDACPCGVARLREAVPSVVGGDDGRLFWPWLPIGVRP